MMPNLSQRSAKSTLGVPTASFAPILINFGRFGVTPGAQKEPIRAIWGGHFPIWRAILDPGGRQGGLKIDRFGVKVRQKSQK